MSIANPRANFIEGNLDISWQALDAGGTVKVWVAATNNFKDGGKDAYQLLGEAPLDQKHLQISVKNLPSSFYKIWIEAKYNSVNRWVIIPDKPKN